MEVEPTPLAPVRTSLLSLADYVEAAQLRIPRPETPRVERTRDEVAWSIREYLVPRLDDPYAPAVAVVAGPGGTGKSAILNAIARRHVSESGVMRPTTVEPVVWGPRSRSEQAWTEFLHRLREQTGTELDVVIGDDRLTEHVIFIDTPPLDLTRPDGRLPALEALGLADICIFVTSASRYADASGWMYLEAARRRGVPILHVINRLPSDPNIADELLVDYVARLHGRDLLLEPDTSLVFPVVEGEIDPTTGGPPAGTVGALRGELAELGHTEFRSAIINQTVLATTHAVAQRARRVGADLAVEVQERSDFDADVAAAYDHETQALTSDLGAGRFAELADAEVWGLAAADLTGIVTRRAGVAAQEAAQAWDERPGGQKLLADGGEGLRRHGQDTAYDAQRLLEQWYDEFGERAVAASRRKKMWSRTRQRVMRQLWPDVLDPARNRARSLTRRFGTGADDLVAEGRDLLASALAAALDADSGRFARFLGPGPDAEILREIETRAEWIEALVEDEVELVPIRPISESDTSPSGPNAAQDDDAGFETEEVQEIDSSDELAPDLSLEPSPEPPTAAESEAAADDPSAPTGPSELPSPLPADGVVETDDGAVAAEVAGVTDVTEVDGGVPHLGDEVGGEMPQASEGTVADGRDVDETPDDVAPDEDGVEGGEDGDEPDESSPIEEDPDA